MSRIRANEGFGGTPRYVRTLLLVCMSPPPLGARMYVYEYIHTYMYVRVGSGGCAQTTCTVKNQLDRGAIHFTESTMANEIKKEVGKYDCLSQYRTTNQYSPINQKRAVSN